MGFGKYRKVSIVRHVRVMVLASLATVIGHLKISALRLPSWHKSIPCRHLSSAQ